MIECKLKTLFLHELITKLRYKTINMKVLKFGGTSVGSPASVRRLKQIVESSEESLVVVVSALGGVTDRLISTSRLAVSGDAAYEEEYQQIVLRHTNLIKEVLPDSPEREALNTRVNKLLAELKDIFQGVYLVHDLSQKSADTIVSYGERLSSIIISAVLNDSEWIDARYLIKTLQRHGRHLLDQEATHQAIKQKFKHMGRCTVVGGFISCDSETNYTTNLGRGGSDYTASIIAATLDATILEIWTDVDGFMTADPRVISRAYTIKELTYVEAMELCNFGAKVLYPPTIYPVCEKDIPILIKNTFNPESPGTLVSNHRRDSHAQAIKGISSINDTSLITITGLGMVGVIGVNYRIFRVLAKNGISVFLVSQASSENSTSIGVRNADAVVACKVLNQEFAAEIKSGEMSEVTSEPDLATVAIVGEHMKHTTGIAGKLFGTLGSNGINVIACAQGASETNISFVITKESLRKALNVIHDSFFLSEYKVLNLFICGIGTVGSSLIEQLRKQQVKLMEENRLKLRVVGIANSRRLLLQREGSGIDLANYKNLLKTDGIPSNAMSLGKRIVDMNIFNSVFVDTTASEEVAVLYKDLLSHNISVVAANKVAASSRYEHYLDLKSTARHRGVRFLFETNVGAGLPIINTMSDLVASGDRITKIEAVLSGTLNYIFNTLSADVPFSETILKAKEVGYAEPDPRIDLSGKDVLRKLVILSREAGYAIEQEDVIQKLFVPDNYFEGTLEDFWAHISELDASFEQRRQRMEKEGKRLRFVARLDKGKASIGLEEVDRNHPFYELEGSNNIVLLTTARYKECPLLIQGYGAGASVTAAGVFADIMRIASV